MITNPAANVREHELADRAIHKTARASRPGQSVAQNGPHIVPSQRAYHPLITVSQAQLAGEIR
jgi:hypothetical protein